MVLRTNKCQHDGCNKHKLFGFDGHKAQYYHTHRAPGMINVVHKCCVYTDCKTRVTFAFEGHKRQYCASHCLIGMIDANNKHCQYDQCGKHAKFGYQGNKALFCGQHRLNAMVDLKHKCCEYDDCNKQAHFGYQSNKPAYCSVHRLRDMTDVVSLKCKTEGCGTLTSKQINKGYCLHCFMHVFPNEKIAHNYKIKENEVLNFIVEKFSSCTVVRDRRIQDGCSARRPDVHIDLGEQLIVVEVDENQHKAYDCSCENKRIMDLSRDVGHRHIVFIRFNPDSYITNGIQINSCFSRTKQGFLIIPKSKKNEWNDRLNVLHETIKYWMKNTTDKTVEVVQLYYDNTM